jgi:CRP-like cAMP-binding protein
MPGHTPPTRNEILRRLPAEDYERLTPDLEDLPLSFKQVLHEQDGPVSAAYFMENGVVSIVTQLEDGMTVETATVGNEGVVGLPLFLQTSRATSRAICQIEGSAKRIAGHALRGELQQPGTPLLGLVLRYTSAVIAMTAQTAACNRMHPVEERLSRWLLMMMDRVGSPDFAVTQEFLAQMLGVRRPTVNIAGAQLQKAGLIRYTRGKITVTDRPGLESTSCECYARIRDEFASAMGPT